MPSRSVVAKELAEIFKIIAHPDRIRLIEDLRGGEKDVSSLAQSLDLANARVSQHLSLLRAHRFVEERREGRRHLYHLSRPEIASWIIDGLDFLDGRNAGPSKTKINAVRKAWTKRTASTPTINNR